MLAFCQDILADLTSDSEDAEPAASFTTGADRRGNGENAKTPGKSDEVSTAAGTREAGQHVLRERKDEQVFESSTPEELEEFYKNRERKRPLRSAEATPCAQVAVPPSGNQKEARDTRRSDSCTSSTHELDHLHDVHDSTTDGKEEGTDAGENEFGAIANELLQKSTASSSERQAVAGTTSSKNSTGTRTSTRPKGRLPYLKQSFTVGDVENVLCPSPDPSKCSVLLTSFDVARGNCCNSEESAAERRSIRMHLTTVELDINPFKGSSCCTGSEGKNHDKDGSWTKSSTGDSNMTTGVKAASGNKSKGKKMLNYDGDMINDFKMQGKGNNNKAYQGKNKSRNKRKGANDSQRRPAGVSDKDWNRRFYFWSRYDLGVRMDTSGFYEVTPESVAAYVAQRLSHCEKIVDGTAGCGGNLVQLATFCRNVRLDDPEMQAQFANQKRTRLVLGVDLVPTKLLDAVHNLKIYEFPGTVHVSDVADRTEFSRALFEAEKFGTVDKPSVVVAPGRFEVVAEQLALLWNYPLFSYENKIMRSLKQQEQGDYDKNKHKLMFSMNSKGSTPGMKTFNCASSQGRVVATAKGRDDVVEHLHASSEDQAPFEDDEIDNHDENDDGKAFAEPLPARGTTIAAPASLLSTYAPRRPNAPGQYRFPFDAVFLSPPWGGPAHLEEEIFRFSFADEQIGDDLIRNLFHYATSLAPNIVLFLPRHQDLREIAELAAKYGFPDVEVESVCYAKPHRHRKMLLCHFGPKCVLRNNTWLKKGNRGAAAAAVLGRGTELFTNSSEVEEDGRNKTSGVDVLGEATTKKTSKAVGAAAAAIKQDHPTQLKMSPSSTTPVTPALHASTSSSSHVLPVPHQLQFFVPGLSGEVDREVSVGPTAGASSTTETSRGSGRLSFSPLDDVDHPDLIVSSGQQVGNTELGKNVPVDENEEVDEWAVVRMELERLGVIPVTVSAATSSKQSSKSFPQGTTRTATSTRTDARTNPRPEEPVTTSVQGKNKQTEVSAGCFPDLDASIDNRSGSISSPPGPEQEGSCDREDENFCGGRESRLSDVDLNGARTILDKNFLDNKNINKTKVENKDSTTTPRGRRTGVADAEEATAADDEPVLSTPKAATTAGGRCSKRRSYNPFTAIIEKKKRDRAKNRLLASVKLEYVPFGVSKLRVTKKANLSERLVHNTCVRLLEGGLHVVDRGGHVGAGVALHS
ncbi:unnamed protein product [Amoebophrya sp. A120]|nr:unnamed protein product [Amoebophrya sp. A120]|eukprot:GSA120T00007899001.1